MITVATTLGTARVIAKTFDPLKSWYYIDQHKVFNFFLQSQCFDCVIFNEVTYAYVVTRMLTQMVDIPRPSETSTESLKVLVTAGECLSANLMLRLREKNPNIIIVQGYGSTESAGVISLFRINDPEDVALLKSKPGSCGRPVAGLSYKVGKRA